MFLFRTIFSLLSWVYHNLWLSRWVLHSSFNWPRKWIKMPVLVNETVIDRLISKGRISFASDGWPAPPSPPPLLLQFSTDTSKYLASATQETNKKRAKVIKEDQTWLSQFHSTQRVKPQEGGSVTSCVPMKHHSGDREGLKKKKRLLLSRQLTSRHLLTHR